MKILYVNTLFVTLLLFSCGNKQEKTKPTVESITESVYASGIIKSKNQYQVFASANGLLMQSLVSEGSIVKKGDLLFIIQNNAAQLNKENARLAAEFADLKANQDKLNDLKINIELAQSKLENDSLLYFRQKKLWEENIGSKVEYEQREIAYKNSLTAYNSAKLRLNDLQKQLEFSSKQSKKNLEISASLLNDFLVRSNIDGKVYSVLKEPGEIVTPQLPLAIIGDAENFLLELQIDEYDIVKIKVGQKVLLTMDSYKDKLFEAVISRIIPIMNERTRSFLVEAEFVVAPETLYPNLTAEANIVIQTKENALTISRTYLLNDSSVVLENKEIKKVKTGLKDYNKVEIVEGINAETVILKP